MSDKDQIMDELIHLRNKIVELERQDLLFKETEEHGKIGGWQFDPLTLKQTWSEGVFRILEVDIENGAPEVPKGMDFIDPAFRSKAEKAVQRAMEYGEPYNQEWIVTSFKGNKKWVNAVCNPKIEDGKVDLVSGSFQDITSVKIAQKELEESEKRLKEVIDNSPFPIAVVDEKDHDIQYWSKSAIQLFGHNPKTSEEWYELAYPNPEYRREVVERWKPFLKTAQNADQAVNTGEYEVRCKNGEVKICEIYAQFIPGAMIVTLHDISLQKDADGKLIALNQQLQANEQQLRASNQQLRATNQQLSSGEQQLKAANQQLLDSIAKAEESEERYRELVNTLNSGVAIYGVINDGEKGSDYIIKEFNEFALKHEQLEKNEIVGRSLKEIRPNIDEYGLISIFQKVWKTGVPSFFPAKEYVDEKYSNYYENRIFRLPSGEIVAIFDDVTDRKNAEKELKTIHENLEQLVEKRTEELENKNKQLERINKAFVGRELRMKELKEELEILKKEKNND